MRGETTQTLSPAMTDPETIRALAQINKVRAQFDAAPAERRRPIYTLPTTPEELAAALWADCVTPQHLVYEECCVADIVADALGTGWGGVEVTEDRDGRAVASARPTFRAASVDDYQGDDTPGDDFWPMPLCGVLWTGELAKLAAYLQVGEGARA